MGRNNFEADIKKATSGNWVVEQHDWASIFEICSKVATAPAESKPALQAVLKRLRASEPEVQFSTLIVLEAMTSNCGVEFQRELCSRDFYDAVFNLWRKRPHPLVLDRIRALIEEWTAAFGSASHGGMMQKLYNDLKLESFPFSSTQPGATSSTAGTSSSRPSSSTTTAAAASSRRKEDEELSRAIALSLQDSTSSPSSSQFSSGPPSSSMYPTLGGGSSSGGGSSGGGGSGSGASTAGLSLVSLSSQPSSSVIFQVRALYDFTSEDDNEISFKAGELVNVHDNSDENWWSGSTLSGSGLFPASFVTRDLTVKPEPEIPAQTQTSTSTSKTANKAKGKVEIREPQIDLLLDMLHNADATVENEEEDKTLKEVETECGDMKPLIAKKISDIDRERHALQELNQRFQDALGLYQQLMKDSAYGQPSAHIESAPPLPYYSEGESYNQPPPVSTYPEQGQPQYQAPPAGGVPIPSQQPPQHRQQQAPAPVYQASPPVDGGSGYYANPPMSAPAPQQPYYQSAMDPQLLQQQHQQQPHQQPPPQGQPQQLYQGQQFSSPQHHHHQQQPPPQQHQQQQQQQPQQPAVYAPGPAQHNVSHSLYGGTDGGQLPLDGFGDGFGGFDAQHAYPPEQVMPDGSLL